ncbi:MAG: winged helix-turn-helix transcriptional regulator [Bacteroidales bacterium]|nr:winged helix-turn-helix transcriptional regulator [Bacteroidales bacterium]
MDNQTLYTLVTNSTALEGSTLTLAQNRRLLAEGISSEGKTIAEQLMNLDLRDAYELAERDAARHEVWSSYRIRQLASKALRNFGFDASRVSSETALQKICLFANESRMHSHSIGAEGMKDAGKKICADVCEAALWPSGNGMMGRLLQNMLEMEFGLELSTVASAKESTQGSSDAAPGKPRNAERILQILEEHPRYTTNDLAGMLGISVKGVEKHLAKLKKAGRLLRIGPDKGGHWEVPAPIPGK